MLLRPIDHTACRRMQRYSDEACWGAAIHGFGLLPGWIEKKLFSAEGDALTSESVIASSRRIIRNHGAVNVLESAVVATGLCARR